MLHGDPPPRHCTVRFTGAIDWQLEKGVSEDEVTALFTALDTNKDGQISLDEFTAGMEKYAAVCRAASTPGMRVVSGTGPQDPWKDRPKDEDGNSTDPYCRHCQFKKTQCHCDSQGARLHKASGDLPKLTSGDISFASFLINYMVENPGPGLTISPES